MPLSSRRIGIATKFISQKFIIESGARLAERRWGHYVARVNGLTKQEITVLSLIAALLLLGWLVKCYRATHH